MDSRSGLRLPRGVVLALWLATGRGNPVSPEVIRHAVQSGMESHRVIVDGDVTALTSFLADRIADREAVAAALPVPGDVLGVPAEASAAASVAGECVLVAGPATGWALVPEVERYGSDLEPGLLVSWRATRIGPWRTALFGAVGSLADAERELAVALRRATRALDALDVARWREDAAARIAALVSGHPLADELPVGADPRAVRVLTQAARLRAIVDLATADDGGAVNLWQADQRLTALREVDRAARRAMGAATMDPPR